MKLHMLCVGALAAGATLVATVATRAEPTPGRVDQAPRKADDALAAIARDAYVYGYPLVTMEMTRRHSTNVAAPDGTHAPMGQFANMRTYPSPDFKGVTAPNADTLYSAAWLDLSKEPYVLELPDEGKRFYMMPMLDGWTNVFANPGTRTTGTRAQKFLITGPGYTGTVPAGLHQLKSPTALVWIVGRTYSTGTPDDYKAVHALQDRYKLMPLGAYGRATTARTQPRGTVDPAIDMKTPPRDQVNRMSGAEYFAMLAELLKTNPPAPADAPMVAKLAKLGIVPGQSFDATKADPAVAAAIQRAPKEALPAIVKAFETTGTNMNGWRVTKTGEYGTDYLFRATVAFFGLGANRAEDAIYPTAKTDARGNPLDGKNSYVLTFPSAKDLPPVKGFWSITLYDQNFFFVKNALNRQTISARDRLKPNPDGSISVYIQNRSPGPDKESNWLPAPAGPFVLMMRLYWPNETPPTILDGSWKPPGIEPAPQAQARTP